MKDSTFFVLFTIIIPDPGLVATVTKTNKINKISSMSE